MNQNTDIKSATQDFIGTFNKGGKNDDVSKHYVKKGVETIVESKETSKVRISDRRID